MKTKNLLFIAAIGWASLLFGSCSKDQGFSPEMNKTFYSVSQSEATDVKAINESLDHAALIVATSLKDPALRSFIKAEALKQFDGDYDILYHSVKNVAVDGRSLESILSENMSAKSSGAGMFENSISNIPNFQISVPVHCEQWNAVSSIPLVAIAPADFSEKESSRVKAYDSNGNVHWLDSHIDPAFPVVVVGISERVDANGKLKYSFEVPGNKDQDARTNGQNTKLGSFMCPDVSDIESWINGKPELRLRVCGSKLSEPCTSDEVGLIVCTKYYNPKRNDVDGKWYDVNTSLFNWYRYWSAPTDNFVYGSDMKFYWVEEDGGGLVTLNINIYGSITTCLGPSASVSADVSFKIGGNDEDIGDAVVYYGDPTDWYVYSTGDQLKFEID